MKKTPHALSIIPAISILFSLVLTSCSPEPEKHAWEDKGELLSEKEDFKNFPQASHIHVVWDLSQKEMDDYSNPRTLMHIYPDDDIIRNVFTHSSESLPFPGSFDSDQITLFSVKDSLNKEFLNKVNPVLNHHGYPEIRKKDVNAYWRGRYSITGSDDFWYNMEAVIFHDGSSFILFTKIPKEVLR